MNWVMTGAMGGGKTAVLRALAEKGRRCVAEPAREILREQRALGGSGVPETDPGLFTMLMLSRALHDFTGRQAETGWVFDRGVPDMVAYAELFALDTAPYWKAAEAYRYGGVLYFPPWEEIYTTDDERKIRFEGAREFGWATLRVYQELGYDVVEVPRMAFEKRFAFVEATLGIQGNTPMQTKRSVSE